MLGISPCCPVLGFPKNLELILVLILKVVFLTSFESRFEPGFSIFKTHDFGFGIIFQIQEPPEPIILRIGSGSMYTLHTTIQGLKLYRNEILQYN